MSMQACHGQNRCAHQRRIIVKKNASYTLYIFSNHSDVRLLAPCRCPLQVQYASAAANKSARTGRRGAHCDRSRMAHFRWLQLQVRGNWAKDCRCSPGRVALFKLLPTAEDCFNWRCGETQATVSSG